MKKRDIIIIVTVAALALIILLAARFIPKSSTPNAGEFKPSITDAPAADTPKADEKNTAKGTADAEKPKAANADKVDENGKDANTSKGVNDVKKEDTDNAASKTDADASISSAEPNSDKAPIPTLPPAKAYLKIQVGTAVYDPIPLTGEDELTIRQPEGFENVASVTEDSVFMLSANCDNQNCVHQGKVTLYNRDSRVLQNMIICLPNHVVLELLTPEEAQAAWEDSWIDRTNGK